ncbi:MAG TPA: GNAT family N-acetyltransferase [Gemmataceae bacterium]|nr:GNAT family N-acetyltransferase [Gemmataceae bacterium]
MSTDAPLSDPAPLQKADDRTAFDCGVPSLTTYLQKYAWQNQQNRSSRTYVVCRGSRVVGYYTLAAGAVRKAEAPVPVARGLGNYPVPIILIARLAVDHQERGKGLGARLLKDALLRCLHASNLIGARAVLVHAKDAQAASFYQHFGFEPSPIDALHLFLAIQDIQASIDAAP